MWLPCFYSRLIVNLTFVCLLVYIHSGTSLDDPIRIYESEAFFQVINNGSFDETRNSKDPFEFIASVEGMPDLPAWMFYRFPNNSRFAYLYGTAPVPGNFDIEIIAVNKRTYDIYRDVVRFQVLPRQNLAQFEVQIKLINLNTEDMFNSKKYEDFLSIFREILWKNSQDVYLTKIVSPNDIGERLPANPRDKEGVIIRVGSTNNFTRDLLDLEREVEPIKNRDPCPSRYKFTRVEHYFRGRKLFCDWCSFKLIREAKVIKEATDESDEITEIELLPSISYQSSDHIPSLPFNYTQRDYHDDLLYCIYIPLGLCLFLLIILSPILFTKDISHPAKLTEPELIKYQSIERATSQLRELSADQSQLRSSPATLPRTKTKQNSSSVPNLIKREKHKESDVSFPASIV